jgi:hypothetical protein
MKTTPLDDGAPPMGRLYDVGGQRLMPHRSGTGGPAVVFLSGAGEARFWRMDRHADYGPLNEISRNRLNARLIREN